MGTGKENNSKTSLNDVESWQWIVKYQYLILFQVFCGYQFYFYGRKKSYQKKICGRAVWNGAFNKLGLFSKISTYFLSQTRSFPWEETDFQASL